MATSEAEVEALGIVDLEADHDEFKGLSQMPIEKVSSSERTDLEKTRTNLSAKPGAPGTTGSGNRPYSSFSEGRKWFIVTLSAVAGTFS